MNTVYLDRSASTHTYLPDTCSQSIISCHKMFDKAKKIHTDQGNLSKGIDNKNLKT